MLASQAHSILDQAAAANGGWTALQSIKSIHLESEGQDWEPWQAYDIGGTVDVSTFRIATDLDLGAGASRVEMDAEVVYPWPHRVAYVEITDAQAGMLADLSLGAVAITRLHPSLYATARRDFAAFAPEALRLARADAGAALEGETSKSVRFRHHDADRWATLGLADDCIPMSLTYADHDPAQGDIAYRFEWSDWRDVGGIRLPYRSRRLIEGQPIREERLRLVTLNEPASHKKFTIPAIVRSQNEAGRRIVTGWTQRRRAAGLPYEEYTRVQHADMTPLAPGVWLARGGTHNSLVIEMADHLVVFEPPLFEGRSEGVIAAGVLFTADLVSDAFPLIPPFASRVHALIQENALSVEMIACAHGNAMPYAQFAARTRKVSGHEHDAPIEGRDGNGKSLDDRIDSRHRDDDLCERDARIGQDQRYRGNQGA